jgi:hypothetical protein
MSKVAISGNASGTGVFTLAAPNSNTDRTLTLPDEAGTVLTTAGVPASAMPAGSVLQVVNGSYGTQQSFTSGSWTATGFALSITPQFVSSKILVLTTSNGYTSASSYLHFTVYRDTAVNLGHATYGFGELYGNSGDRFGQVSASILDAPATTSAISYEVYARVSGSTGYMNLNTGEKSTMTLVEIAV